MDIYGEKVNRLIGELGRLPGIGGKTAQRLAFHIINMPEEQVESLSAAITDAKKNIRRSEEHTSELQSLKRISYAVSLIGRAHV